MGKAERIRAANARERIAAQQAAAQRAEARKRMFLAGGSVLAVIVVVLGLIIWKSSTSSSSAATGTQGTTAEASLVTKQITSVPVSTLNAVGKGTNVGALIPTTGQPALTSGGKPQVDLQLGAEYCPYCAAERWGMVVALSRFGTFSNLSLIHIPTPRTCTRALLRLRSTGRATPANTSPSRRWWRCTAWSTTASPWRSRRPPRAR